MKKVIEVVDKDKADFLKQYILNRVGIIETINLNSADLLAMINSAEIAYDKVMEITTKEEEIWEEL